MVTAGTSFCSLVQLQIVCICEYDDRRRSQNPPTLVLTYGDAITHVIENDIHDIQTARGRR